MYVSHHLEEMFEIGDRVTILRDGKFAKTARMSELLPDPVLPRIAMCSGRDASAIRTGSRRFPCPTAWPTSARVGEDL